MVEESLATALISLLAKIEVCPRLISLDSPGVNATIPMLRGVWGAALRNLDRQAYEEVFVGTGPRNARTPSYVMRPSSYEPSASPDLEFIVIGRGIRYDNSIMRAWNSACGMGLGPQRRKFRLRTIHPISPCGALLSPTSHAVTWDLSVAPWPVPGGESAPCRLEFPTPLRLIRRGRLVEIPRLSELVIAGARRLSAYLQPEDAASLQRLEDQMLEASASLPGGPWRGERLDLVRYSGRQHGEIELRGVIGSLVLPQGPGELWPLFAAARWLHLGKGTIMGLGKLEAVPI